MESQVEKLLKEREHVRDTIVSSSQVSSIEKDSSEELTKVLSPLTLKNKEIHNLMKYLEKDHNEKHKEDNSLTHELQKNARLQK